MEDPKEGVGETEIGETEELLGKAHRFLDGLDPGSDVHEQIRGVATVLEDKLERLTSNG